MLPNPVAPPQLPATSTLLGTQGTSVTTIYKDGLAASWRDASYGCDSEFADKSNVGPDAVRLCRTCTGALAMCAIC